ncbi:hypothetical protein ONZ45_g8526 [Pleurotus djamor]|nr:hypothetical protein ONZ45_g8526 [Pleurotus djamor]
MVGWAQTSLSTVSSTNPFIKPVFTDHAAQQSIDSEIATHEAAILRLRHRRNMLTAIYCLPEDILLMILMLCKDNSEIPDVPWVWRTLLAVCSQWRRLALASPRFSSTIVLSETHNLDSMLHYSAQVPLHLYYTLDEINFDGTEDIERASAAFGVVLGDTQNAKRVQQLVITCAQSSTGHLNQIFQTIGTYGAPSLQELSIIHKGSHNGGVYIHHDFFPWDDMPSLRHLELRNTLLLLHMPVLPNLKTLTLANHRQSERIGMPVSYVIEFLRRTPNVEIVNISHIVEDWDSKLFSIGPLEVPTALDKLRSLTITSDPINGCNLLKRLSIPHPSFVDVFFTSKLKNPTLDTAQKRLTARTALISLFSAIFAPSSLKPYSPKISVMFRFGESTSVLQVHSGSLPNRLRIYISNQHDILDLRDFMDILEMSQIPSRTIKLTVSGEHPLNGEVRKEEGGGSCIVGGRKELDTMRGGQWSSILPTFAAINKLFVESTTLPFLMAILESLPSSAPLSLVDRNTSLRYIRMISVDFRPVYLGEVLHDTVTDDESENPPCTPISVLEEEGKQGGVEQELGDENMEECIGADLIHLARIFDTRQAVGLPRIRLSLVRCGITPQQIQFLREHVEVEVRD